MKVVAFTYILLMPLFGLASLTQTQINKGMSVQEIGPDSYLVRETTFSDQNILVTKMSDGSVVVSSSPYDTVDTRELIQWINEKLKPKKIITINTHFHSDGTGGNEAFHEAGAEIWANDITDKLYRENAEKGKATEIKYFGNKPDLKARIEARKVVFADHLIKAQTGKIFDFKGEKVVLKYPGPAHTIDNMVVYFPKRKIIYGTCMVRAENSLGYIGDSDVQSWAKSVQAIQDLEAKIVIPGHGDYGGPELIKRTIQLAKEAATKK
ncbi:MBL fold metallo-hydrolase [Leptospira sp. 2 VSF19]|uniref:beta-lactamase n=1 Tax=Leptospira soteropolitanensis TaxID=2950025 RepID=A0AAW5VK20_9LEPT|nr:MBL fold metallo-hydrolase [Leptospira soteropolitanensis]MCW7494679.1 MBL fold metallo-hydrolase [Leptospira soteropolitanensis]MCW7502258.1 MBL fold metallo-hydrolase [Leptospira soteropolitanensis]MCW7524503.1 MBL fold metallo-hydrolase [Leptospira soteropolitanensis]MCW7528384.1 MBL fold metallo-hydrolase [Leptospira soteropolitanensis]MCW7532213.1 MBL fold metallo-hydrolase [Leptospira soteropolitanensis]